MSVARLASGQPHANTLKPRVSQSPCAREAKLQENLARLEDGGFKGVKGRWVLVGTHGWWQ